MVYLGNELFLTNLHKEADETIFYKFLFSGAWIAIFSYPLNFWENSQGAIFYFYIVQRIIRWGWRFF